MVTLLQRRREMMQMAAQPAPLYPFNTRDYTIATVSGHREYLQVSDGNHFKFYNYRGGGNDWCYASPTNTSKSTPSNWSEIFSVQPGDNVVLKLKNGYVETALTSGKVFINTSLRDRSGARLWGWVSNTSESPLYVDTSETQRIEFAELSMNVIPDSAASIGSIMFYSWGDWASGTHYTNITFECDWEVWVNNTRYI